MKTKARTKIIFYAVGLYAIIPYFNWLMQQVEADALSQSLRTLVGVLVFFISVVTCLGLTAGSLTLLARFGKQ